MSVSIQSKECNARGPAGPTDRAVPALSTPGDEDRFEVLARPPARPPVDVAPEPLLEHEPRAVEDLRVQRPAVVDDDHHPSALLQRRRRDPQRFADPLDVV